MIDIISGPIHMKQKLTLKVVQEWGQYLKTMCELTLSQKVNKVGLET